MLLDCTIQTAFTWNIKHSLLKYYKAEWYNLTFAGLFLFIQKINLPISSCFCCGCYCCFGVCVFLTKLNYNDHITRWKLVMLMRWSDFYKVFFWEWKKNKHSEKPLSAVFIWWLHFNSLTRSHLLTQVKRYNLSDGGVIILTDKVCFKPTLSA